MIVAVFPNVARLAGTKIAKTRHGEPKSTLLGICLSSRRSNQHRPTVCIDYYYFHITYINNHTPKTQYLKSLLLEQKMMQYRIVTLLLLTNIHLLLVQVLLTSPYSLKMIAFKTKSVSRSCLVKLSKSLRLCVYIV